MLFSYQVAGFFRKQQKTCSILFYFLKERGEFPDSKQCTSIPNPAESPWKGWLLTKQLFCFRSLQERAALFITLFTEAAATSIATCSHKAPAKQKRAGGEKAPLRGGEGDFTTTGILGPDSVAQGDKDFTVSPRHPESGLGALTIQAKTVKQLFPLSNG